MKNKVLIRVYVVSLDDMYELYIPTNESIKKILELVIKLVSDFSDSDFDPEAQRILIDAETSTPYSEGSLVRDTNIRNSKLVLLV